MSIRVPSPRVLIITWVGREQERRVVHLHLLEVDEASITKKIRVPLWQVPECMERHVESFTKTGLFLAEQLSVSMLRLELPESVSHNERPLQTWTRDQYFSMESPVGLESKDSVSVPASQLYRNKERSYMIDHRTLDMNIASDIMQGGVCRNAKTNIIPGDLM